MAWGLELGDISPHSPALPGRLVKMLSRLEMGWKIKDGKWTGAPRGPGLPNTKGN